LELHTLAGEERLREGPQGLYLPGPHRMAGWDVLTDRHIGCTRTTQSSEEVSLLPGAIDCLCSCTAGSRQGRRRGLQSIECRPALDRAARVDESEACVAWRAPRPLPLAALRGGLESGSAVVHGCRVKTRSQWHPAAGDSSPQPAARLHHTAAKPPNEPSLDRCGPNYAAFSLPHPHPFASYSLLHLHEFAAFSHLC
jgi:hypothetical protein